MAILPKEQYKIITKMFKTYYRNEYTEKQWKALIDKAEKIGCKVTYGRYGDRAEIDSTEQENAVLLNTGKSIDDCKARSFLAEHIHRILQESTDLRTWKVQPKRYHKGYCPTICKSQKLAEHEQEHLERITGFEWTINSNTGIIMKADYYEVSIVEMDNECNNSMEYIDIDVLGTFKCAKQVCQHTIKKLKAGYYNHQLRGVQYCYITILPYNSDAECIIGLAEDYSTAYYHRVGDSWKKVTE